jgi:hypothetical protein
MKYLLRIVHNNKNCKNKAREHPEYKKNSSSEVTETENSTFPNSPKKSDHTNYLKFHRSTAELEISRHDPAKNHLRILPDNAAQDSEEC